MVELYMEFNYYNLDNRLIYRTIFILFYIPILYELKMPILDFFTMID